MIESEILTTKDGKDVKLDQQKFIALKGEEKWEGAEVQAESTPLVDPNTGQAKIIRTFVFKSNPDWFKKNKGLKGINKQELFNNFWPQLQLELWKDGMKADETYEPKFTFKKDYFFIQITAEPRLGVALTDLPRPLQEYFKKKR